MKPPYFGNAGKLESAVLTRSQITEIQNLLTLNREIKALWIKGPLRGTGEDAAREAELDRKAELVTDLFNQAMVQHGMAHRAGGGEQ